MDLVKVKIVNGEEVPVLYDRDEFDQLIYNRTTINWEEHKKIIAEIEKKSKDNDKEHQSIIKKIDDNHEIIQKRLSTRNLIEAIYKLIVFIMLTIILLNKLNITN